MNTHVPSLLFTTTTTDPTQLQLHLGQCAAATGRLHRLHGALESIHAFVTPRFVSTLLVLSLTAAAVVWLGA